MTDKKQFERHFTGLVRRGLDPLAAYRRAERKHKLKHSTRMYFSYASFVRSTRIKIKILDERQ